MHCIFKALLSNEKNLETTKSLVLELCKLILDSLNPSKQTSCSFMGFNNIEIPVYFFPHRITI